MCIVVYCIWFNNEDVPNLDPVDNVGCIAEDPGDDSLHLSRAYILTAPSVHALLTEYH